MSLIHIKKYLLDIKIWYRCNTNTLPLTEFPCLKQNTSFSISLFANLSRSGWITQSARFDEHAIVIFFLFFYFFFGSQAHSFKEGHIMISWQNGSIQMSPESIIKINKGIIYIIYYSNTHINIIFMVSGFNSKAETPQN